MALQKTLVPLAFGQGLDTKKDKKQQVYGTLRKAENVVFETLDSARKRNGYDSILLQTTTNGTIDTAEYLAKFKNELLLFDRSKLYGFSSTLQQMQEKGSVYSVFPTSYPVLNNDYSHDDLDMALVDGLLIYAYRNTITNEVRYTVQDSVTQTFIVSDVLVASSARTPKLAAIGSVVYIFYGTGADIDYRTFNTVAPASLSVAGTLTNNYEATFANMAAVTVGNRIVVGYCSTNALQRLTLISIGLNNTPSTPVTFASQNPTNGLSLFLAANNRLLVTYASSTDVRYLVYAGNLLGSILAPTVIETISNVRKVSGIQTPGNGFVFHYSVSATNTYDHYTRTNTGTLAGAVGTPEDFLRSVDLATQAFLVDSQLYIGVSYASETQSTYYIADADGTLLAKISPGVAGGHLSRGTLPTVATLAPDVVVVPSLYATRFVADNGQFLSRLGAVSTYVDFVVEDRYLNAALGNSLLISGGLVQAYDGKTIAEHGFNVFPEALTLTSVSTGTPNNSPTRDLLHPAVYNYCAVYKWTDNQGQEHRSAPSAIAQVTVGPGDDAVQVVVPTLRLTNKENVVVEIYRTEDAGALFYLINSVAVPFFNNIAVDTVTFLDGRSDANLISGRLLYTTGGVLENIAPPSARILATHTASDRIFLAGLEDANLLQYSKIVGPGQAVEFNDDLQIRVDPVGGDVTALASMDEKLIIFEEDAILFISGTGPSNTGAQDTFTTPERISTDIGCIDPKSVVLTPDGLMFKSRKGIYLLSRALQISYIGAPVELFNNLSISSAKVVAELNQVRFTTINGACLVYNYVYKFWATFTNHQAKSAEVVGNDYYYLRLDNALYKENRQSFADAGIPIKMRLEIGWISFQTLQGFGRVYKMLLLGDWLSAHNLFVKVGYDFNEAWTQSVTIDPAIADVEATAYGLDSPYGEPDTKPYGGTGLPYQTRVNLKQQKCQSIKLEIEDVQENAGEGFSLSQITFQVGMKAGAYKMPKGRSFATR